MKRALPEIIATFLRKIGFESEGRARTRIIRITVTPNDAALEYGPYRPSA